MTVSKDLTSSHSGYSLEQQYTVPEFLSTLEYVRKIPLQFALRIGIRVKNGVLWALFSSWGRDRSSQNLNLLDMLSAETLPSCFGRVNSSKEIYNRCIFDMKHTYSKIRSLSLNIIPETLQNLTTDITVDLLWRLNFQIIVPHLRC